jgi:hypothetical protein
LSVNVYIYLLCCWHRRPFWYSFVMSTIDCMLSVRFCHTHIYSIYSYVLSTFDCLFSVCFVRLICTLYSCLLSIFNCMLSLCFCHFYMYFMQMSAVNIWLYVVCVFLSGWYVLCTAVFCQPLIVCCLCGFFILICILCRCVLSTCDCMLSVCFCYVYIYIYVIQLCNVYLLLLSVCSWYVYMYSIQLWSVNL